jgi:hypothetical protein
MKASISFSLNIEIIQKFNTKIYELRITKSSVLENLIKRWLEENP